MLSTSSGPGIIAPENPTTKEVRNIAGTSANRLAYSGRGRGLASDDCTPAETRRAVEKIMAWTRAMEEKGTPRDVLTVDNHADGVFVYLKLLEEGREEDAARTLIEDARALEGSRAATGTRTIASAAPCTPYPSSTSGTSIPAPRRGFSTCWGQPTRPSRKRS